MDVLHTISTMNRLLHEAAKYQRERDRYLNQVAEGELRLSADTQQRLTQLSAITNRLIGELAGGTVKVKTVVSDLDPTWALPSSSFLSPYQNLFERVYGTRALKIMDDIGKASAKPLRARTTTNQKVTRGGAKPVKASSTRNLVIDQRAFTFKRTIDRRLRAIASDIRGFLAGEAQRGVSRMMCSSCNRWGGDDWMHCPWCGRPLTKEDQ